MQELGDGRWTATLGPQGTKFDEFDIFSRLLSPVASAWQGQCEKSSADYSFDAYDEGYFETQHEDDQDFTFQNTLCPQNGMIVATQNYRTTKRGTAKDSWADVTWALQLQVCKKQGISPSVLQGLFRSFPSASGTEAVMKEIRQHWKSVVIPRRQPNKFDYMQEYRLVPGSDDFIAMVGLANSRALVSLVRDNLNALGGKSIKSISILHQRRNDDIMLNIG